MTELLRQDTVKQLSSHSFGLTQFKITEQGMVSNDSELIIDLVKGSRTPEDPKQVGVTVKQLPGASLLYLKSVNVGDLATKDTSMAITSIENALLRIENRNQDRKIRKVSQTYNK